MSSELPLHCACIEFVGMLYEACLPNNMYPVLLPFSILGSVETRCWDSVRIRTHAIEARYDVWCALGLPGPV